MDSYIRWIKDNTTIKNSSNWCEITTPFLDTQNDHIQLYVSKNWNNIILWDDWWTLENLKMSWVTITGEKKENIFNTILNWFWVKSKDDSLFVEANAWNIWQKKHYLLQAILAVNDMCIISRDNIISLFREEVERFFSSNELYPSKDIKMAGKTWFDHNIDFLFNQTKDRPERMIKVINKPKKDNITSAIFAINDISALRPNPTDHYIIFNDENWDLPIEYKNALMQYSIKSIWWSKRADYVDTFK